MTTSRRHVDVVVRTAVIGGNPDSEVIFDSLHHDVVNRRVRVRGVVVLGRQEQFTASVFS
jgi:TolB-like protein